MKELYTEAETLSPDIISWRRQLHQIPETGLMLPETAQFVKMRLSEMDIDYKEYKGYSGITAFIGKGGKTAALRADMDALPVREDTGLAFASQNGNMHACGHDAHTAMLLAAAKLLKDHESELPGRVELIFQPGEEGPGGAKLMVRDGALEGVDGIFALHAGNLAETFPTGDISLSRADTFAADDEVVIEVTGKGGHASKPNECVDPAAAAVLIINTIQYIMSHEVDAYDNCVISMSCISAGTVCNIIPDTALIRGDIRNTSPGVRDYVLGRIRDIAMETAHMMRAKCTVSFDGYPPLVNDASMVDSFLFTADKCLGKEKIHILPHGILGGEDAAFFFRKVPGCYFFLSNIAPCPLDGEIYPHHHSRFCIDESVLWEGSGLMAQAAVDFLDRQAIKKKRFAKEI